MRGRTRIVVSRSRGSRMMRVAEIAGTAPACARSSGRSDRPLEPQEPQEPVDEERPTRQIPGRVEDLHRQRQDDDLRHEGEHGARAAEDTARQEGGEHPVADAARQGVPGRGRPRHR